MVNATFRCVTHYAFEIHGCVCCHCLSIKCHPYDMAMQMAGLLPVMEEQVHTFPVEALSSSISARAPGVWGRDPEARPRATTVEAAPELEMASSVQAHA